MNFEELIRQMHRIKPKGRQFSTHLIAGAYQSHFKGKGIHFDQIRKYQYGDDIRFIDWNVTARYKDTFVKVFTQEREQVLMLLVDVSASGNFGTVQKTKRELTTEICAYLAFAALYANERVGAILFSKGVERYFPPERGRNHILALLRCIFEFQPLRNGTDIGQGLQFAMNVLKKKCKLFVVSDFLDTAYHTYIGVTAQQHFLTAIRITDPLENSLSNAGWLPLKHAETSEIEWINTSSKKIRQAFRDESIDRVSQFEQTLARTKATGLHISTKDDCGSKLLAYFNGH